MKYVWIFLRFYCSVYDYWVVAKGVADLRQGAGKILGVTVAISYISTLISGSLSYLMSSSIFQSFLTKELLEKFQDTTVNGVESFFSIEIAHFSALRLRLFLIL